MSFGLQTYEWTRHAQFKMRQYGLSEHRVKRVIRYPYRVEEGVLEGAIAVMQPASLKRDKDGNRTWGSEIWVMYLLVKERENSKSEFRNSKLKGKRIRVVTAWRYPGISPKRDPIPEDILFEAQSLL